MKKLSLKLGTLQTVKKNNHKILINSIPLQKTANLSTSIQKKYSIKLWDMDFQSLTFQQILPNSTVNNFFYNYGESQNIIVDPNTILDRLKFPLDKKIIFINKQKIEPKSIDYFYNSVKKNNKYSQQFLPTDVLHNNLKQIVLPKNNQISLQQIFPFVLKNVFKEQQSKDSEFTYLLSPIINTYKNLLTQYSTKANAFRNDSSKIYNSNIFSGTQNLSSQPQIFRDLLQQNIETTILQKHGSKYFQNLLPSIIENIQNHQHIVNKNDTSISTIANAYKNFLIQRFVTTTNAFRTNPSKTYHQNIFSGTQNSSSQPQIFGDRLSQQNIENILLQKNENKYFQHLLPSIIENILNQQHIINKNNTSSISTIANVYKKFLMKRFTKTNAPKYSTSDIHNQNVFSHIQNLSLQPQVFDKPSQQNIGNTILLENNNAYFQNMLPSIIENILNQQHIVNKNDTSSTIANVYKKFLMKCFVTKINAFRIDPSKTYNQSIFSSVQNLSSQPQIFSNPLSQQNIENNILQKNNNDYFQNLLPSIIKNILNQQYIVNKNDTSFISTVTNAYKNFLMKRFTTETNAPKYSTLDVHNQSIFSSVQNLSSQPQIFSNPLSQQNIENNILQKNNNAYFQNLLPSIIKNILNQQHIVNKNDTSSISTIANVYKNFLMKRFIAQTNAPRYSTSDIHNQNVFSHIQNLSSQPQIFEDLSQQNIENTILQKRNNNYFQHLMPSIIENILNQQHIVNKNDASSISTIENVYRNFLMKRFITKTNAPRYSTSNIHNQNIFSHIQNLSSQPQIFGDLSQQNIEYTILQKHNNKYFQSLLPSIIKNILNQQHIVNKNDASSISTIANVYRNFLMKRFTTKTNAPRYSTSDIHNQNVFSHIQNLSSQPQIFGDLSQQNIEYTILQKHNNKYFQSLLPSIIKNIQNQQHIVNKNDASSISTIANVYKNFLMKRFTTKTNTPRYSTSDIHNQNIFSYIQNLSSQPQIFGDLSQQNVEYTILQKHNNKYFQSLLPSIIENIQNQQHIVNKNDASSISTIANVYKNFLIKRFTKTNAPRYSTSDIHNQNIFSYIQNLSSQPQIFGDLSQQNVEYTILQKHNNKYFQSLLPSIIENIQNQQHIVNKNDASSISTIANVYKNFLIKRFTKTNAPRYSTSDIHNQNIFSQIQNLSSQPQIFSDSSQQNMENTILQKYNNKYFQHLMPSIIENILNQQHIVNKNDASSISTIANAYKNFLMKRFTTKTNIPRYSTSDIHNQNIFSQIQNLSSQPQIFSDSSQQNMENTILQKHNNKYFQHLLPSIIQNIKNIQNQQQIVNKNDTSSTIANMYKNFLMKRFTKINTPRYSTSDIPNHNVFSQIQNISSQPQVFGDRLSQQNIEYTILQNHNKNHIVPSIINNILNQQYTTNKNDTSSHLLSPIINTYKNFVEHFITKTNMLRLQKVKEFQQKVFSKQINPFVALKMSKSRSLKPKMLYSTLTKLSESLKKNWFPLISPKMLLSGSKIYLKNPLIDTVTSATKKNIHIEYDQKDFVLQETIKSNKYFNEILKLNTHRKKTNQHSSITEILSSKKNLSIEKKLKEWQNIDSPDLHFKKNNIIPKITEKNYNPKKEVKTKQQKMTEEKYKKIADKVYQMLEKKIAIEKDRRGI